MNAINQLIIPAFAALTLTLLFMPVLKTVASKVGHVDRPGSRKVHAEPVPLVGGIAIAFATGLSLLLSPSLYADTRDNILWAGASIVMLIVGILDDRFNVRPVYRLVIQVLCAYTVASSGVRIDSLYGILGVYAMPVYWQYLLTIVVITGVVNAYNLMDGIDGLLGGLTVLGTFILGVVAYELGQYDLLGIYAGLFGSAIGFLHFNLGKKKVFMGDAGSLFIGFILIVTSIKLLNATYYKNSEEQLEIFLLIAGIFLVPVLDSLRVYRSRLKKGMSPFTPDKTHLHHLFIFMGVTHKRATVLIMTLTVALLYAVTHLIYLMPVVWVILAAVIMFGSVAAFLALNQALSEWRIRLKTLEQDE